MPKDHRTQFLQIESTPPTRRSEALQLLRIGRSRIQRMLAAESQSELDMRGLFHARRGQELVGAAWGQVIPGRTAFCWPACLVPWEPDETALPLQVAVDDYLDRASVTVVQAVLPVRAVTDANRLVRAGYQYLAELNYLVCFRDRFPLEKPNCGLNFEPGSPSQTTRLEKLVERTYVDSLDCVGLDGMRPIGDVLVGYRATGRYRPEWWLIATHAGQDVGCVLLADHPEHEQCELMYLGMVPEVRGRGWGVGATRHVQWMMRGISRERMVLAVDDNNWPAQGVYSITDFDVWDRRRVYVRRAREES